MGYLSIYSFCNLRHSRCIQFILCSLSGGEVLIADLIERSSGEGRAELEGVLWGGTESALQGGVFASGNEAITVDILNIENFLDGCEAGSSVRLGIKDWEGSSVGLSSDDSLLKVALESIIETEEHHSEDKSSK